MASCESPPNWGGGDFFQSFPVKIECQAQGIHPFRCLLGPPAPKAPEKGGLSEPGRVLEKKVKRGMMGKERLAGRTEEKGGNCTEDEKGQREAERAEWPGYWEKGRGGRAGVPLLRAGALSTLCYCLRLSLAVQC